jgi:teichuronic acid biosynthesis glycosyltransferase TuaC
MRVLIVTKIFPNASDPLSSPFNRQQFRALAELCDVEVFATIPWFPGARLVSRWSAAGRLVDVPLHETIDGMRVRHPRFFLVPKLGHALAGGLYAASLLPAALARRGGVDVVLGSWAYPDGFAATLLARALGVPAVVKVHGSDINVVARMPGPRQALRWALPRAARVVAVSRPLADAIEALGVHRERIDLVPNGVDTTLFHVRDRSQARRGLGLPSDGRIVLYVGRLEAAKGVLDLIAGYARMGAHRDGVRLVLIGDGAARATLEQTARCLRVEVTFAGARPLAEIPQWLAACDVLALPSHNEGTPNAILEALACGRRVVASAVGGIPDLLQSAKLGELVAPRDPDALAVALSRAVNEQYDPCEVAQIAAVPDWRQSAVRLHAVLQQAVACDVRVAEQSALPRRMAA